MDNNKIVTQLRTISSQLGTFESLIELLEWDQQTYMPSKGTTARAQQLELLTNQYLDLLTAHETAKVISKVSEVKSLSTIDTGILRIVKRAYEKKSKVPKKVELDLAQTTVKSHEAWAKAKNKNDFKSFQPWLEKIIDLKQQIADAYGYEDSPYDALIDDYEEGMTEKKLTAIFGNLREASVLLLKKIEDSKVKITTESLQQKYPINIQKEFSENLMELLEYHEDEGRLDESEHPFTISLGPGDARITTHYDENNLAKSLFAVIHETGHALYELGFPKELAFTGLDSGASLGIHESQSRFWENMIGRSEQFWDLFYPIVDKFFPQHTKRFSKDDYFKAVNKVEPSLIRIYADEVTYNLHIIIRFEIEKELIKGNINVSDLPEVWNEKMKEYIGVAPKTDSEGVLQDVHWSSGYIGYFPTYALGNVYAAQFMNTMKKDLNNYDDLIEQGKFKTILDWLRKNIHKHGSIYSPSDLVKKVTGEELTDSYYVKYLDEKFGKIYKL